MSPNLMKLRTIADASLLKARLSSASQSDFWLRLCDVWYLGEEYESKA